MTTKYIQMQKTKKIVTTKKTGKPITPPSFSLRRALPMDLLPDVWQKVPAMPIGENDDGLRGLLLVIVT
jgi:hypothetical protein